MQHYTKYHAKESKTRKLIRRFKSIKYRLTPILDQARKLGGFKQKNLDLLLINTSQTGSVDRIYELLKQGAKVGATDIKGETALMKAVSKGHFKLCKFLVETAKADVDTANINGVTPLMYAAILGDLNICKFLIDNKANMLAKDILGMIPYMYAYDCKNKEVSDYIYERMTSHK